MTTGYLKPLSACFALSILLLAILTKPNIPQVVTIGAAALPLIGYHWGYLAPRAKSGLSQNEIDTVYYYGFLLTVVSLGLSGISLSDTTKGNTDNLITTVGTQFGFGLLATAYAVAARVHLSAISTSTRGASPEDGFNQVVEKSFQLAGNIEIAAFRFESLAKTIEARTEATVSSATNAFAANLSDVTAQMKRDLEEVRAELKTSTLIEDRKLLRKNLTELGGAAEALAKTMKHLAQASSNEAAASIQLTGNSLKLNTQMSALTAVLGSISGPSGVAADTVNNLTTLSTSLATHSEGLSSLTEQLKLIEEQVAGAVPTFKAIRSTSKKVSEQVDSLGTASTNLEAVIKRFGQTSEGVENLSEQIRHTSAILSSFGQQLTELENKTKILVTTSTGASRALEAEVDKLPQVYARAQAPITTATDALTKEVDKWTTEIGADLDRSRKAVELLQDMLIKLTQNLIDHVKDVPPNEATNG